MVAGTDASVVRAEGFTFAAMVAGLGAAGTDFVRLLRSLDPADGERPVPDMAWTASETAAHMLTIVRRGMGDRRRSDSIEGLAVLNDESIVEIEERDPHALADLIQADLEAYIPLLQTLSEVDARATVVRLHAGLRADVPTALSYQLFDFLGHGLDIARATDRPWTIEPEHASLVLRAGLLALRPWVRDDALDGPRRSFAFAFPGEESSLIVTIGGGDYAVRPAARELAQADVDPVEMFLAVAGRLDAADPLIRDLAERYRPI